MAMEEDHIPQLILFKMLQLITSVQRKEYHLLKPQEYTISIDILGEPVFLKLQMECLMPYLIELSQESNHRHTTGTSLPLEELPPLPQSKSAQIYQFKEYTKDK